MTLHELSFARVIILDDDLVEVIVNHGVEVTADMVDEYHAFVRQHLQAPFLQLFNKINDYSYNFDAQLKLGALSESCATAALVYKHASELVIALLQSIPREIEWNLQAFSDREIALAWLCEYRDTVPVALRCNEPFQR